MTAYTVPDRRDVALATKVIDPTLTKDSTAGLQQFIYSRPAGSEIVLPFDLRIDGELSVTSGRVLRSDTGLGRRARLVATVTYPWRVWPDPRETVKGVPNPGYNPNGICAPWLYDLNGGNVLNPYGRADKVRDFGGWDGTTGASGVDYDAHHLSTRITAPFTDEHVGMPLRVVVSQPNTGFSANVGAVLDAQTVHWSDHDAEKAMHETSTHTVAWGMPATLGWACVFTPCPSWRPKFYGPDDWHAYEKALRAAIVACRGRTTVNLHDGARAVGLEIVGPNTQWGQPVINLDKYSPVVNEFQCGICAGDPYTQVVDCDIHHQWGDGVSGPGQMLDTRIDHVGRQCTTGHYDDKLIDGCVLNMAHHAAIDFETAKNPVHDVTVLDTTIGGHGISMSVPLVNALFDNVHSTQADVDAGTIDALASLMRGNAWGAPGASNITVRNGTFDMQVPNLIACHDIDGLTVQNMTANVAPNGKDGSGYVVRPWTRKDRADQCTNVDVADNDGGTECLGQIAP